MAGDNCFTRTPYATDGGVYRFVECDGIAANWSQQWRIWDKLHSSDDRRKLAHDSFILKYGFDPHDPTVPAMTILDAGCGNGQFSALFAGTQHTVWAADLSYSVRYAAANIKADNLHFVQADLNDLPFPAGYFDFIFSNGVLIHVKDIRASIFNLVDRLRPGGTLGLAVAKVHENNNIQANRIERIINFYRTFTTKLPPSIVLHFSHFLSFLYNFKEIPGVGYLIPEWHPDPEWRKCYIHDYLTARYRERQRPEVIAEILAAAGLIDIVFTQSHEIRVTARKPE